MVRSLLKLIVSLFTPLLKALKYLFKFIYRQMVGGRVIVKRGEVYYIPIWVPIAVAIALVIPVIWDDVAYIAKRVYDKVATTIVQLTYQPGDGEIAEFFEPSVQYWANDISKWSDLYDVDTQLMATVMQIESCGHPTVVSSAGARGLFQVMPFHFATGENMVDPDTNAKRGGNFLNYCYTASGGDIGLTLACYNGGPSVINRPLNRWPSETQRYYRWGVGIYSDAIVNRPESETLNQWMNAGGSGLCVSAMNELRNYSSLAVAEAP